MKWWLVVVCLYLYKSSSEWEIRVKTAVGSSFHSRYSKYFCQGFCFHHDREKHAVFLSNVICSDIFEEISAFLQFANKSKYILTWAAVQSSPCCFEEFWNMIENLIHQSWRIYCTKNHIYTLYSINILYLLAVFQSYQFMSEFRKTCQEHIRHICPPKNKQKKYIIFCLFLTFWHYFHYNGTFSHYRNAKKTKSQYNVERKIYNII